RRPEADPIAEPPHDDRRILPKRFGGGAHRPPTCILERLRRIPVEERRERLEILGEELGHKTVVEVQTGVVHSTTSRRHDAGPRDRETKGIQPELLHEGNVIPIPVIEPAGDFSRVAVSNLSRSRAEAIPDAFPTSILVRSALDLVRRGGGSPDEVVWKRAISGHRSSSPSGSGQGQ